MCSISASNWHFICTNDIANRNGHLEGSRRVFEVNRKLRTTWTTIGLDIYHSILVILTNRYVGYRPNQTKPKKRPEAFNWTKSIECEFAFTSSLSQRYNFISIDHVLSIVSFIQFDFIPIIETKNNFNSFLITYKFKLWSVK